MNYRSFKPWVTQDSDDSDDEIRLRHVHRRRIRLDQRRGINTIPDDNQSPINSSSPSETSHSQSNTSSSESGWLSTLGESTLMLTELDLEKIQLEP